MVKQTITVNGKSQTISFTSTNPSPVTVGGATYTAAATASSGLTPVVFSIDVSSTTGACTSTGTNGVTITFTGIGTWIVDANQAGNSTYAAAPVVKQTITVNGKSQTISFTSTNPSPVTVGGATYTAAATASSGLTPVVFSIDARRPTGAWTSTGTSCVTITFTVASAPALLTPTRSLRVDLNQRAAPVVKQTITVNGNKDHRGGRQLPGRGGGGSTFTATVLTDWGLPAQRHRQLDS